MKYAVVRPVISSAMKSLLKYNLSAASAWSLSVGAIISLIDVINVSTAVWTLAQLPEPLLSVIPQSRTIILSVLSYVKSPVIACLMYTAKRSCA